MIRVNGDGQKYYWQCELDLTMKCLKSFSEYGDTSSFGVERLKTKRKTRYIGNISM